MRRDHSIGFNWHDAAYWGVIAAACAVFLVMNMLTTLKEDDLAYCLIEGDWTPIRSLGDWLQSFGHHYTHSNGRWADLVAMLFGGLLGKTAFNVCNTLVFGLLLHLLSILTTGRRSLLPVALFLAVTGTCYPVPGETMLWMAGSCNYLWAITASLLLVTCLRHAGAGVGWGRCALLLAGGFVAGAFNEATSFGFLLGLALYYAFNRSRVNRAVVMAMTGYLLGVILLVASPGAWTRVAEGGLVVDLPMADLLYSRWNIFIEKMWRFYLPVLALAAGLVLLLIWRRKGLLAAKRSPWPYVFTALLLVMLALGVNEERAYAPLVTVAFILITIVADRVLRWHWARVAVIVMSLALAAFTYARGVKLLREYRTYDLATVGEIVNAPNQAILCERQFTSYSRFIKPMNYNSSHYFAHEIIYRSFFGKMNVQFVSDSVYVRYHQGRLLDGASAVMYQCEPQGMAGPVYTFPDQDYVAILLNTSFLPCSFQTARYYWAEDRSKLGDSGEMARRQRYGLPTDYNPYGFYPLIYQGRGYLVAERPDSLDNRLVFPVTMPPNPVEITLTRAE